MSAVNDIVTPYDLPQAKDALKLYVPELRKTYNAEEVDDEHPLRFVDRAATFDHSDERDTASSGRYQCRAGDELLDSAPDKPRAGIPVVRPDR